MQAIDQNGEELVRVLLLIPAEHFLELSDGVAEVSWRDALVPAAPQLGTQHRKLFGYFALCLATSEKL